MALFGDCKQTKCLYIQPLSRKGPAKLNASGFNLPALKLMHIYPCEKRQR